MKTVDKVINIQTGEELDLDRVEGLKDNALLKHRPDLWETWDFEKNNELGLDVWKLTKGLHIKTWWICLKCNSSYDCGIANKVKNRGCPYCRGLKANDTNSLASLNPQLASQWHPIKNGDLTPHDITCSSNKTVWWKCKKCDSNYDMQISLKSSGIGCPYCSGRRINKSNSLNATHPQLVDIWNFELNKKISPDTITFGSNKKAWWTCLKCESDYLMSVSNKVKGCNCPYCAGQIANHTNSLASLRPDLASEWHPTKNNDLTPHDVTCGSGIKVWWSGKCEHEWESVLFTRVDGKNCPYCANKKILAGFNDLWTTNPEIANMLANPKDGYHLTHGSKVKVNWKCQDCGNLIKNKTIPNVKRWGLNCNLCGDGISFPEKIFSHLLTDLNISFETQKIFNWSNKKRYDFYLPEYNMIIETHGGQHYFEGCFEHVEGRSLIEEQVNDRYKHVMAMYNRVNKYIVIDCRYSELEWIKSNILNSELVNMFNLNNVNWNSIDFKSKKSLHITVLDMWNNKESLSTIRNATSYCDNTIRDILRKFAKRNLCQFVNFYHRPILQLNLNGDIVREWETIKEISSYTGIKENNLFYACKQKSKSIDGFIWIYKDIYEKRLSD